MTHSRQKQKKGQLINLNEGLNATAEAQIEGFEAKKVIDKKDDSYWAATPYFKWWKLDLKETYAINEIEIHTNLKDEGYTHYFIEGSQDNLNWETIVDKRNDIFSDTGEEYEVDCTARYLRVTVTYSELTQTAKIRELKVRGQGLSANALKEKKENKTPKFLATDYAQVQGFDTIEVDELEPDKKDKVLMGKDVGSYLYYPSIDFNDGVDQMRGQFGFTDSNKKYKITLEIRVDDLHGEKVGEIVLFKQWKMWSVLGGHLEHPDPKKLMGIHDVYFVIISADEPQELMIHWLAFMKKTVLPEPNRLLPDLPEPASEYQVFFGNLHSHTDFSDGESVPEHAFDYARDEAGLDFFALTEHSNLYDNNLDWDKSRKLIDIKDMAEKKTKKDSFLALYGSETTWYNQFGHMNTYNIDFFINAYETRFNDIPVYYETLKSYPASINQWNHPWSSGNRHLDGFEPYDEELDKVLHLLEVNPIESKELGGLHYYVKALDKGWHISPVGNQDNHKENWGTQNNLRTGVLVEHLTKRHFYDAVRRNRTYFTSALHLKTWFRINGEVMGSKIKPTEKLDFEIKALYGVDTGHCIVKIEVISTGGQVLHTVNTDDTEIDIHFSLPCERSYYFIKIYQDDGEFAATSPIWIEE